MERDSEMKKLIIILCLSVMVSFSGCTAESEEPETEKGTETNINHTEETSAETKPEEEEPVLSARELLKENMPGMDGSTSTIPLEAGARAEILGITHSEAEKQVEHTKTHEAFNRLLNNEVDLILSVPVSEEQLILAEEKGFELESVPVAMEGFVFVVNEENPVDTLSAEQIRRIYSGEITNWKEVGGLDEPIIAYQRNRDSGSQNYMTEFMGGVPLMEVPMSLVPGFMGGLMDAVSVYDNSRQAIGYSVYSYAAQMYANANRVKFVKVDGVEPNKQTFSDKTYPLLSCTYAYFDKALPSDSNARLFAQWLSGEEGQLCVLKNGYVPVADIEIPPEYMLYESLGTGKEKPSDYAPSEKIAYASLNSVGSISDLKIDSLKDKGLETKINEWIEKVLINERPQPPEKTEPKTETNETGSWMERAVNEAGTYTPPDRSFFSSLTCVNGYLSIVLGSWENNCPYFREDMLLADYNRHLTVYGTAVYDLFSGERLENFSDLFYKDTDFLSVVNNNITKFISDYDENAYQGGEKTSFAGLLGDINCFTFDNIILKPDNPYFYCGTELDFTGENLKDNAIIWEYRDHSGLFIEKDLNDNGDKTYQNAYLYENDAIRYITEQYLNDNGIYYEKIVSSRFISDSEIEKMNMDIETVLDKAVELGYKTPYIRLNYKNMYTVNSERYFFDMETYFDKDTLEIITEDDLLMEGWRDIVKYDEGEKPGENDSYAGFYIYGERCNLYYWHFFENNSSTLYTYTVPTEYVNEKYRD